MIRTNVSLKKNAFYNISLQIINMLFPLITFPYLARVLEPEGMGKLSYVSSIIAYFILISSLGIPIYGIREIAKAKGTSENINKVFSEIFIINMFFTFISLLFYILFCLFFSLTHKESLLYIVMGSGIILNLFTLDWFYGGIEDYKYITERNILFKIISIVLIFLFVKTKNDYIISAAIGTIIASMSGILNFLNAKKSIKFRLRELDVKKHLKPIFLFFIMNLAINVYFNINITMLGAISGTMEVGYYSTAFKVIQIILSITGAIGTVTLARISFYKSQNSRTEEQNLINKSEKIILFIAIPVTLLLIVLSKNIIMILGGAKYFESVGLLYIIIPVIFLSSLTSLKTVQVIIPSGKEYHSLIAAVIGAILCLVVGIILIPIMKGKGAAIAFLVSELAIFIYFTFNDFIKIRSLVCNSKKYIIASIISIIFVSLLGKRINIEIIDTIIRSVLFLFIYFSILLILKDEIINKKFGK